VFTRVQVFSFLFMALIAGFLTAFFQYEPSFTDDFGKMHLPVEEVSGNLNEAQQGLSGMMQKMDETGQTIHSTNQSISGIHSILSEMIKTVSKQKEEYALQKTKIETLVTESKTHRKKSFDLLDQILSNILGEPIGQTFGKNASIKVFSLKEAGYRGYMAKVRLHNPNAVKLVLAHDKVGDPGEKTSEAAKRMNAVLALNGGGFATTQDGLLYPMGITVVDGEIKTFYRTDLSFIGFDQEGKLVGGEITTREQIRQLGIMQGATFVPILLKDGKKMPIPKKWQNRKEPRTLIGHFLNGDLLFIVIDGRQEGYSNGVTLEEAQNKLIEFNVRDAYNLDGGGSSTFYYNGKILNSPSDGEERPLASHFVILP
jgi:exopolysaccharide biosynthesis protein